MVLVERVESIHEHMSSFSKEMETVRKNQMKLPGKEQQPE